MDIFSLIPRPSVYGMGLGGHSLRMREGSSDASTSTSTHTHTHTHTHTRTSSPTKALQRSELNRLKFIRSVGILINTYSEVLELWHHFGVGT